MKVSVITVTYNSSKWIKRAILSVNNQTHNNVEHIFIDGGSQDDTVKIINESSTRTNTIISEGDNGIYDAMNKGLRLAEGEIICFLNSDDYYRNENILESVENIFKRNECGAVISDIEFINERGKMIRHYKSRGFKKWMFNFGFMPAHPGTFISKKIASEVGDFKTNFEISSDFDFLLRLYKVLNKKNIKELDQISVIMQHGGISTRNLRSNLVITREMHKSLKSNKEIACYVLLMLRLPIKLFDRLLYNLKNIT